MESGVNGMKGNPWSAKRIFLENSPLLELDNVTTPVLLIHGTRDEAVPLFLADQVFVALKMLGKTVIYARYENEGHNESAWTYGNQRDYLQRMIAWFEQHLSK
jgi:dipeptidyl aminopeptidase/acylaminoacyl peptidase